MVWFDEKLNFSDIFLFSRQLTGVVVGFYLVLIGVIWHIREVNPNAEFLEPFFPKVITFTGLIIFITGCIWLTASFNQINGGSGLRTGHGGIKASVYDFLTADEKKIIDLLVEKGGEAFQSELVSELDFSKSKLSELLTELEMRNVVEKTRIGKTNKVRLV